MFKRRNRILASGLPLILLASACSGGTKLAAPTTTVAEVVSTTPAATEAPTTTAAPATTAAVTIPPTTTIPKPTSVVIRPLFVQGTSGGVGTETISVGASTDGTLRMDFSEDEVNGLGDQSRAASWSAVTVATLLSGAKLQGDYRFEIKGPIDGPSAGALKTVAVLSLMKGDTLQSDITMTGTINPDGTVGPVGGIPEKIKGAAAEKFKRVLIPVGQRNSPSEVDGSMVDVVSEGQSLGVQVTEVNDVYQAYQAFTGKNLPRLADGGNTRLDDKAYTRLKAKADEFMAKYDGASAAFGSLDPSIQSLLTDLATLAGDAGNRSRDLSTQGLQAGAFTKAVEASAYANSAVATGEAIQVLLTSGIDAYLSKVGQAQAIQSQVFAFFDLLKTFEPKTVSDASGLMAAYASAIDSLTIAQFASSQVDAIGQLVSSGQMTVKDAVGQLLLPTAYFEIAGAAVEEAKAIFEVGRDLGGAEIKAGLDVAAVADFFRKGGDANFAALQSNVIKSYSTQLGVSEDAMLTRFENVDIDVALAVSERNTLEGLKQYIGAGVPNAEYAQLGFSISNYSRTAGLVMKYYSNGSLDDQLNIVGVRSEAALSSGLDLGKSQLSASISQLRAKTVDPTIQVASFEVGNVEREGTVSDKFQALVDYWNGLISSRVLAYLGGFETDGLQ
jgi:uncharacterized protein